MNKLNSFGELALGSRLKRLSDTLMKEVKKIYKSLYIDFEPAHMPVFKTIDEESKISIGDIASALSISQPAVTQFVNALEKKKLILTSADRIDKRKKLISLSKKGQQIIKRLQPIWTIIDTEVKNITSSNNTQFMKQIEHIEGQIQMQSLYERVINSIRDKVTIIPYADEYASIFRDLNIEWLEKYFYVEDHDKEVLSNPKSYIINNEGYIFFAKYEGKIVGTVALINEPETYELSKMAVVPNYQGLKIGQKLMEHCVDFAKQKQWRNLMLYSNTKLTPAINMYRKNDWIEVQMEANVPYERSDIKMILELN